MKTRILFFLIILAAWTGGTLSASAQSINLLFEGFEGSFPADNGWTAGNSHGGAAYWEDVTSAFGGEGTHTGTWKGYCAGTQYPSGSSEPNPMYPPVTGAYMRRSIDLRGYGCPQLTFWYKIPSNHSADCNVFFGGDLVWSRSTPAVGWNVVEIPLDSYAGGIHTLEFRFVSNEEFFAEGWYLDDILVTATPGPSNDLFANAAAIAGSGGQVTGTSVCATKDPSEPNHAGNAGGASVWWRWTAANSGPVTVDTVGSSFDTLLAVYTGNSVGSLTLVDQNDDIDGPNNRQSRVSLTASAGTTYQIAVDGYDGANGNVTLTLRARPTITMQPQSQNVIAGNSVTFTASATGTSPLSYQWRFNGTAIAGATSTSYTIANVQPNHAGTYDLFVSNGAGAVASTGAILSVLVPPTITSQPQNQDVIAGNSATFSVSATGTPPLSYQWRFNTTPIGGATGTSYTIANAQQAIAGNYDVVVSNSAGSATSTPATLTVRVPPSITMQPQSQDVIAGTSVTFNASANGTAPLSYQWRFNGTPIGGATGTSYTIANVQPNHAGTYDLFVSNSAGAVASMGAILTVRVPPTITSQPQNRDVVAGNSATFSVSANGTAPLGYQWRFNTTPIGGATSSSYTIANAQMNHAGNYDVIVSNSAGSVTSMAATLTVRVPPTITSQPQNRDVVAGNSATFNVSATGTTPLSYQWRFNGTPIGGATSTSYTIANAQPANEGFYDVVVSNSAGTVASLAATLMVGVPPTITGQPQNRDVVAGNSATFSVSANGTTPLSYQWRFNTTPIGGATSSSYTIANAQMNHAGNYDVIVSNSAGSVTSMAATLTVRVPPTITSQPQNQDVIAGNSATFTVSGNGTAPLSYQWRFNSTPIGGATSSSYTIANAQMNHAGNYDVMVSNSGGSVTSVVATLTVLGPPTITTQPQNLDVIAGNSATFTVSTTGTAPLSYQWRINGGPLAGATSTSYTIANAQPANAGNYDVIVSNSAGSVTSVVATLTVRVRPTITSQPQNQDVIAGNSATFSVSATGTAPLSYQWRLNSAALAGATSTSYTIANAQANHAGNYDVIVSNSAGSVTSVVATLTVLGPPTITTQPQSQDVIAGNSATFSVSATGTPPLSYQWRFNGAAIGGATSANYPIANAQSANAGNYDVIVSNSAGSVTSVVATLTVLGPPTITTQPQHQDVNPGDTATFSVSATGTPPLSYQWRLYGFPIEGATTTSHTIPNVQPSDAGLYDVLVRNNFGAKNSAAATLTVLGPPTILIHPQSQEVIPGDSATFTVRATGTPPLSYQWRLNGFPIEGATTTSHTIPNVQHSHAGLYDVLVRNNLSAKNSDAARLTVQVPPTITSHPQSYTMAAGGTVTFSVRATGSDPLSYQWRLDGFPIAGATSSSHTIADVQPSHAGLYDVVVRNNVSTKNSAAARLTVRALPTILVNNLNDAGPGSLRQAIKQANSVSGDHTIHITAHGTIKLTSSLLLQKNMFVIGPGPNFLTVSGNGKNEVFKNSSIGAGSTIANITISDGGSDGIRNSGTLTVLNCVIQGNTDGIFNETQGRLTVKDSTIRNNSDTGADSIPGNFAAPGHAAEDAAGGGLNNRGLAKIYNSTFTANTVTGGAGNTLGGDGRGGAILNGGDLSLFNCTLSGNVAQGGNLVPEGNFLTRQRIGPTLSGSGAGGTLADAKRYYKIIDPDDTRLTLGAWWRVNGFDQNGRSEDEVHVAYLNNNDLGFGRDMHMHMRTTRFIGGQITTVASYVANYGGPSQNPLNADAAAAKDKNRAGATVCMEYNFLDAFGTEQHEVSFFVFNGVDASAPRLEFADLDGNGQKFVPYLCTVCHGGVLKTGLTSQDRAAVFQMGSSFREFDIATFKFPRPGTTENDPSRSTPTASEQEAFYQLNQLVKLTRPAPAIRELIDGWYAGGASHVQDSSFVPAGWRNSGPEVKDLYQKVIATSCRTCHVALQDSRRPQVSDFSTYSALLFSKSFRDHRTFINNFVFRQSLSLGSMPHAKVTFKNFWKSTDPHLPDYLGNWEGPGWTPLRPTPLTGGGSALGGAIYNQGTLEIVACTITENSAISGFELGSRVRADGAGVYSVASASTSLRSSIIAANFVEPFGIFNDDCFGHFVSEDYNLIGTRDGFTMSGATIHNLIGFLPLLGPLLDNGGPTLTHALRPGSPAIDAGDNSILVSPLSLALDQRGSWRRVGGAVDIGAVELEVAPISEPASVPAIELTGATFEATVNPGGPETQAVMSPSPLARQMELAQGVPANDPCSGAVALSAGTPYTINTGEATDTDDPAPECSDFGKGVWFSFTPAGNGIVSISTCASDFDTVLQVYTGSCSSLTPLPGACNDDDGPLCAGSQASASFDGTAGITYYLLAGGWNGTDGLLSIVADVLGVPANDQCSGALALSAGTPYTLDTGAATDTNDPMPTCRGDFGRGVWFTFTPASSGAVVLNTCDSDFRTVLQVYTGSCGSLTPVPEVCNDGNGPLCLGPQASVNFDGTAGTTYYILAGGSFGAFGSLRISADVLPALANDPCSGAIALSAGTPYTMNTLGATSTGDPMPTCRDDFGKGVWFSFTPASSGAVVVSTCASDFSTVLQVYTGSCNSLTPVPGACDDFFGPVCLDSGRASVSFAGTAGTLYYILAGGSSGAGGSLSIVADVLPALVNDQCSGAIALSAGTPYTMNTLAATGTGDPTPTCQSSFGRGVWFSVTLATSSAVHVNTCASDFSTVLQVYTGSCGSLTPVPGACDDFFGPLCPDSGRASVSFAGLAGTTYYILAGGSGGGGGSLSIVADVLPVLVNDQCNGAIALSAGTPYTMNTLAATGTGDPTPVCQPSFGRGVWFSVTLATSRAVHVGTCGSDFSTVLQVYTGSCGSLTPVPGACDDFFGPLCSNYLASVSFGGLAGSTYYILAGGSGGSGGSLSIMADVLPVRTLTVASAGTGSGVFINLSPGDLNREADATTPFARSYVINTVVTLSAPLATGGDIFFNWQRDGADFSTDRTFTVTMDADHTLTAVYQRGEGVRLITSVVETGGDNEPADTVTAKWTGVTWTNHPNNIPVPGLAAGQPYTVGRFGYNAPAMVDRTHRYADTLSPPLPLPAYLVGQEYIMCGNDNRDNAAYRLDVTVSGPAQVYLLIDNRLRDGNNADPPIFGATNMQWVLDQQWAPARTGANRAGNPGLPDEVGIDENADGTLNQWFSVYTKSFPAGTFTLFQPDNAGQNMYGVVARSAASAGIVLTIKFTSTNTAVVSWPSPSTGWNLQQNANLTSTGWATPSEAVTDDGLNKSIIVNRPAGNRFYRLFKP